MRYSIIFLGTMVLHSGARAGAAEPQAPPPWQGNRVGISDEVLSPWTPIAVTREKLELWDRIYRFGKLPLPASVITCDAEMLAGPITLRGRVNGKPLSWTGSAAHILEARPQRARLGATADPEGLRCEGEASVEYDGMIRCDLRLYPRGGHATIEGLALEIPLAAPHAIFLHTWPGLAGADEETGSAGTRSAARMTRPEGRGFDVQLLVDGHPLAIRHIGGRRFVDALPGADYELRVTNPLPVRVAVALSVDGLNTIDARQSYAWDASKWLIRPHQTLTVSGWQVSTDRARRFYFTTERDSYAARLGRPADFGIVRAVFFRERQSPRMITPRTAEPSTARREAPRTAESLAAPPQTEDLRRWHDGDRHFGYEGGRAATGLGRPARSEVDLVEMRLERLPVAEVEIRYGYPATWDRPEAGPRPEPEPGIPPRGGPAEDPRFCPERAGMEGSRPG